MKGGPFRCPPFDSSVAAEENYLTLKVVTIPSWMCRGTSQTTWIVPFFLKMIFSVALPPGWMSAERLSSADEVDVVRNRAGVLHGEDDRLRLRALRERWPC